MNLKSTLLASGAFGGMTASEQRLGRFIRDGEGHPAPAPTPAPTPEPTAQDAFDAAFAENAAEPAAPAEGGAETPPAAAGEGGEAAAGAEGGEKPAGEGEAAQPGAAAPAGDAGGEADGGAAPADAGKGGAAPAAPAATPPAGEQPAGLTPEQILENLAKLVKPGEAPAAPAAGGGEQPQQTPMYTEAEQATLTEYEKNWPDVSAAEALKRRAEYADVFKFVFTEVANYVAPLFEQMKTVGNTLHTQELVSKVPEYSEDLEANVTAWVDTQPAYLQAAYKQVMQTGTSDEVADLIGRYREATGTAPAAPAPAAPAAPAASGTPALAAAPVKTELSSAAKQAAESLAPVSGDRSAVPQGEDTQDFDTAFAKYATAGG